MTDQLPDRIARILGRALVCPSCAHDIEAEIVGAESRTRLTACTSFGKAHDPIDLVTRDSYIDHGNPNTLTETNREASRFNGAVIDRSRKQRRWPGSRTARQVASMGP